MDGWGPDEMDEIDEVDEMVRLGVLLLAFLMAACQPAPSTGRRPRDLTIDSAAVAAVVRGRLQAALGGDTAAWHRYVADDAVWTGPALKLASTRDVIVSIAANKVLPPARQEIQGLQVVVQGDVAHASYVQVVDAADGNGGQKKFRKTDTYTRRASDWVLVAGAEVAILYRAVVSVDDNALNRWLGTYVLAGTDTLHIVSARPGRLAITGGGASPDTLLAESDSSFFQEGERGTWIFRRRANERTLTYRGQGQPDIVLTAASLR